MVEWPDDNLAATHFADGTTRTNFIYATPGDDMPLVATACYFAVRGDLDIGKTTALAIDAVLACLAGIGDRRVAEVVSGFRLEPVATDGCAAGAGVHLRMSPQGHSGFP